MKLRCSRCCQLKPDEDFAWRRTLFGQRDSYCRLCRSAYKKKHYARNKARYKRQAKKRAAREIPRRMEWIASYLDEHPCVDCGETDILVLQFDHRSEARKRFDVAAAARYAKWESVVEEISNCDVRCANCHRRITARRGNFYRWRLAQPGGLSDGR